MFWMVACHGGRGAKKKCAYHILIRQREEVEKKDIFKPPSVKTENIVLSNLTLQKTIYGKF